MQGRRELFCTVVLAIALAGAVPAQAVSSLNVDIFRGFNCCSGDGSPYSSPAGSFTSPDIQFATNTGYNWHPFGFNDFGADITGSIIVSTAGTYTFTLNSDDGSRLFIDGSLVVDDGNAHAPQSVNGSALLTVGQHAVEVRFFECCGGPSGVDLTLPNGVQFGTAAVPEPATWLLLATGLTGLLGYGWRRKQQAA